jgi:predicted nucleic acid-binding protein
MITAIDTNILLDILIPNEDYCLASARALEQAATRGSLVISDIVYAELCVYFDQQKDCESFLDANEIRVQALSLDSHFRASRAWRAYRQRGGKRVRILSDFLIGAHAEGQASRLVTRDRGFYQELFPSLQLHDPSAGDADEDA